jgi:hypothetical protein
MANSLLTISMITREAVRLFRNSNAFIMNINRQYDDAFAKTGAKIGTTLRIRLPNDYTVTSGPALSAQDTTEQSTTLTVATQQHVDVSFNSVDRTMSLDDYSERVLSPMINNLAGAVASTIMGGAEGGVCNYVANTNASTGAVIAPTSDTWLNAGATLDLNSAQMTGRKIVADPRTMARTVNSLSGLFNPSAAISKQYKNARVYDALNFDWFQDQTVIKHTTGSFSAGTVASASQTGTTITTNAITGTLALGDIITFANVYAVNRVTKVSTGELRQFVVTAASPTAPPRSRSIRPSSPLGRLAGPVSDRRPPLRPASAAISLVNNASEVYRKNIAYAPDAVTMVTADLMMPEGVMERARETFDGLSMRMVTQYIIGTDQAATASTSSTARSGFARNGPASSRTRSNRPGARGCGWRAPFLQPRSLHDLPPISNSPTTSSRISEDGLSKIGGRQSRTGAGRRRTAIIVNDEAEEREVISDRRGPGSRRRRARPLQKVCRDQGRDLRQALGRRN